MFSVEERSGRIMLRDGVPEVSFEIKVEVKDMDGLTRTSTVRIEVVFIEEDAVYNSGSVRITGGFYTWQTLWTLLWCLIERTGLVLMYICENTNHC